MNIKSSNFGHMYLEVLKRTAKVGLIPIAIELISIIISLISLDASRYPSGVVFLLTPIFGLVLGIMCMKPSLSSVGNDLTASLGIKKPMVYLSRVLAGLTWILAFTLTVLIIDVITLRPDPYHNISVFGYQIGYSCLTLALCLSVFAVAVLIASFTGTITETIIYSVIYTIVPILFYSAMNSFLDGMIGVVKTVDQFDFFAPLGGIYLMFMTSFECSFRAMWPMAVKAVALSVIPLILGLFAFSLSKHENAGKFGGNSLFTAFTAGLLSLLPAVGIVYINGCLTTDSALIYKSLLVFIAMLVAFLVVYIILKIGRINIHNIIKAVGIFAVTAFIVQSTLIAVRIGVEHYVPTSDKVESATICYYEKGDHDVNLVRAWGDINFPEFNLYNIKDAEKIKRITNVHKELISMNLLNEDENVIQIVYKLKSGKYVARSYYRVSNDLYNEASSIKVFS